MVVVVVEVVVAGASVVVDVVVEVVVVVVVEVVVAGASVVVVVVVVEVVVVVDVVVEVVVTGAAVVVVVVVVSPPPTNNKLKETVAVTGAPDAFLALRVQLTLEVTNPNKFCPVPVLDLCVVSVPMVMDVALLTDHSKKILDPVPLTVRLVTYGPEALVLILK